MLGCVCGVSQYPQFFVEYLDMYQILPRLYLRSFDGDHRYKLKKLVLELANQSEAFFWGCIESRIISDDKGKMYISQYWTTLKKTRRRKNKYYAQHAELGKLHLLLWLSFVVNSTVITPKI